ncbi:MAG: right-handed parallel beta-helix repeat-containing protein, partial [Chloroflexota bacterium]|nr:right-handed parallel beta-helix repeat-containing protein [Chloroflexota bacterium]
RAAQPGERILIRPGHYEEPLTINKPLTLAGDGPREQIIISAANANVIAFTASAGRVVGLTLRQTGGGQFFCVDIGAGRLELEDCDISSQSLSAVGVHDADPILRRNRVHDSKQSGVMLYGKAKGLLEENDIFANTLSGVGIKDGATPTLRRNRIHDGKGAGVFVYELGQGLLEDNDIFANALSCVEIKEGGAPTLRRNRIHDGKEGGVFVQERGQGLLEDNDIFANGKSGVEIKSGATPTVRANHIHHNHLSGVYVQEKGLGVIEGNEIYGNVSDTGGKIIYSLVGLPSAGIEVVGSTPTVKRNTIRQNNGPAIHIRNGGGGVYEENDLRGNSGGAWNIRSDCLPHVTRRANQE